MYFYTPRIRRADNPGQFREGSEAVPCGQEGGRGKEEAKRSSRSREQVEATAATTAGTAGAHSASAETGGEEGGGHSGLVRRQKGRGLRPGPSRERRNHQQIYMDPDFN